MTDGADAVEQRWDARVEARRFAAWPAERLVVDGLVVRIVIERVRRGLKQRRVVAFGVHVRIEGDGADPRRVTVPTAEDTGGVLVGVEREQGDEVVLAARREILAVG